MVFYLYMFMFFKDFSKRLLADLNADPDALTQIPGESVWLRAAHRSMPDANVDDV